LGPVRRTDKAEFDQLLFLAPPRPSTKTAEKQEQAGKNNDGNAFELFFISYSFPFFSYERISPQSAQRPQRSAALIL